MVPAPELGRRDCIIMIIADSVEYFVASFTEQKQFKVSFILAGKYYLFFKLLRTFTRFACFQGLPAAATATVVVSIFPVLLPCKTLGSESSAVSTKRVFPS
jgi:hypothetical protein